MSNKTPAQNIPRVVAEYQPQLKAFVRKRVAAPEEAEDILQEVFLQFAKAATDVLNPIEQVGAWLYRVARNTIINRGKKRREQEMPYYRDSESDEDILTDISEVLFTADTAASPSAETEYLRSLVWEELEAALGELPPGQREAFEKSEFDGLPVKEIAALAGVPVNTVLSRKRYAVLHLRERLADLYEELILC